MRLVLKRSVNDNRQESGPCEIRLAGYAIIGCGFKQFIFVWRFCFLFSVFDFVCLFVQVDKKKAIKEARAKAPAADQFAQSKMKAEIVNPYKQNWILVISIVIGAADLRELRTVKYARRLVWWQSVYCKTVFSGTFTCEEMKKDLILTRRVAESCFSRFKKQQERNLFTAYHSVRLDRSTLRCNRCRGTAVYLTWYTAPCIHGFCFVHKFIYVLLWSNILGRCGRIKFLVTGGAIRAESVHSVPWLTTAVLAQAE